MNINELINISIRQIQRKEDGDASKIETIKTHITNVTLKDGRVARIWVLVEV